MYCASSARGRRSAESWIISIGWAREGGHRGRWACVVSRAFRDRIVVIGHREHCDRSEATLVWCRCSSLYPGEETRDPGTRCLDRGETSRGDSGLLAELRIGRGRREALAIYLEGNTAANQLGKLVGGQTQDWYLPYPGRSVGARGQDMLTIGAEGRLSDPWVLAMSARSLPSSASQSFAVPSILDVTTRAPPG